MLIDYFDERKLTVLDLSQLAWNLGDMPDRVLEGVWPVLRQHGISVQLRYGDHDVVLVEKAQSISLYSWIDESPEPVSEHPLVLMLGVAITSADHDLVNLSSNLTVYVVEFEESVRYLARLLDFAIRMVSVKQLPYLL